MLVKVFDKTGKFIYFGGTASSMVWAQSLIEYEESLGNLAEVYNGYDKEKCIKPKYRSQGFSSITLSEEFLPLQ